MHEVFVWVPTKGWHSVGKFRKYEKAHAKAVQMEPLEVKLVLPDGQKQYGGQPCMPDHTLPAVIRTL